MVERTSLTNLMRAPSGNDAVSAKGFSLDSKNTLGLQQVLLRMETWDGGGRASPLWYRTGGAYVKGNTCSPETQYCSAEGISQAHESHERHLDLAFWEWTKLEALENSKRGILNANGNAEWMEKKTRIEGRRKQGGQVGEVLGLLSFSGCNYGSEAKALFFKDEAPEMYSGQVWPAAQAAPCNIEDLKKVIGL